MRPVNVLVVDDDPRLRATVRRLLASEGFQIVEAGNGREAMELVAAARTSGDHPIDIIVSDLQMPEASGLDLLQFVRRNSPDIEVILMSAVGHISDAVAALRLGAVNFIEKPFEIDALMVEVKRAQLASLDRRNKKHGESASMPSNLVGDAPSMRALKTLIGRVGQSDSTVLILGESGTGKELVARAVHDASRRKGKPFVAVHCGAIPETLFESELFGHVKGAFTGAVAARDGRFAQADGGTIFLDEIGEMPLAMQVKLLRVLQEKTYEPVGGSTVRHGDFRVLAATNRDLSKAVAEGTFRQDLFYRLNVVPIEIPPLRDRLEDLPALCKSFVDAHNADRAEKLEPPDEACLKRLMRYPWPGNVRELEHLIERVSVLKGAGPISESDLPIVMRQASAAPGHVSSPRVGPATMNLNSEMDRLERELIRSAMTTTGGNKNRAAQILGVNRTTLIEKMRRLGMNTPSLWPKDPDSAP